MSYRDYQPDKGGHVPSAKASISLPFTNPQKDEPKEKPSHTSKMSDSSLKFDQNDHKGSVR